MTRLALELLDPGARASLERIWAVLPQARLVGGVVRDLLASAAISDLDLGVPDPPQAVTKRLEAAGIRCLPTGLAHGTVTALVDGQPIEITSLRRDEQTDGRHAVVAWTTDWRQDAERRDFTINAMSLTRDGTLFDYFGGYADLLAHRVRFVGEARARIAEDGLRILRFFRFNARYGGEPPDAEAARAIEASLSSLDKLSAERVWSEFRRILSGPRLEAALSLMQRLGVLEWLLQGSGDFRRVERLPTDPILRLAALVRRLPAETARALRLSNDEAERLAGFLGDPAPTPTLDDDTLRRLLADTPADLLSGRAWLAQIRLSEDEAAQGWNSLHHRLRCMPRPVFPLSGRDALAFGVKPGPEVGRLLANTRAWWLGAGCIADRDACLEHLRILL